MNIAFRYCIGLAPVRLALIGQALLLTLGCTPQPSLTLGKVTGTVFHNGQPVPNMSIEFHPVSGGRPSLAFTNQSGHFEAIYLANVPGAKIGEHTIRYELTPGEMKPDITPAEMLQIARPTLADGSQLSPTQVTVSQGENHFKFELIPAPSPPEESEEPLMGEPEMDAESFIEPESLPELEPLDEYSSPLPVEQMIPGAPE